MAQGHFLSDIYRSDKLYHNLYKKSKDIDTAAQLFVNDNDLLTSSTNIQVFQSVWYSYFNILLDEKLMYSTFIYHSLLYVQWKIKSSVFNVGL